MPPVCVAIGCKNTNDQAHKSAEQKELEKKCKITFHVFPTDPVRRRIWINIMELNEKDIKKSSRLCSLHFHEKYFDRTSLACVRLRENAIPHLPEETKISQSEGDMQQRIGGIDDNCESTDKEQNKLQEKKDKILRDIKDQMQKITEDFEETDACQVMQEVSTNHNICGKCEGAPPPMKKTCTKRHILINDNIEEEENYNATEQSAVQNTFCTTPVVKEYCSRGTCTSPEKNTDSILLHQIRKTSQKRCNNLQRKVKVLQKKVRWQQRKITAMSSLLVNLKQKRPLRNTAAQLKILNILDRAGQDFSGQQLQRSGRHPVCEEYTSEFHSIAQRLHDYSTGTDKNEKRRFDSGLPHLNMISNWYKTIDGESGISDEALARLREELSSIDYLLVGASIIDKASVR